VLFRVRGTQLVIQLRNRDRVNTIQERIIYRGIEGLLVPVCIVI
jgi:hypothetical protein